MAPNKEIGMDATTAKKICMLQQLMTDITVTAGDAISEARESTSDEDKEMVQDVLDETVRTLCCAMGNIYGDPADRIEAQTSLAIDRDMDAATQIKQAIEYDV